MYKLFRHLVNEYCFAVCTYAESPGSLYLERHGGGCLRCDVRSYGVCVYIRWAEGVGEAQLVVKEITNADIKAIAKALSTERYPRARHEEFVEYVSTR